MSVAFLVFATKTAAAYDSSPDLATAIDQVMVKFSDLDVAPTMETVNTFPNTNLPETSLQIIKAAMLMYNPLKPQWFNKFATLFIGFLHNRLKWCVLAVAVLTLSGGLIYLKFPRTRDYLMSYIPQSIKQYFPSSISLPPTTVDNNSSDISPIRNSLACIVCEDKVRQLIFNNCGHFIVCDTCGPKLKDCPICRTPGTAINIFFS